MAHHGHQPLSELRGFRRELSIVEAKLFSIALLEVVKRSPSVIHI